VVTTFTLDELDAAAVFEVVALVALVAVAAFVFVVVWLALLVPEPADSTAIALLVPATPISASSKVATRAR
jgi:hypothetical protein